MEDFKIVDKNDFHKFIGHKDAITEVKGKYPYLCIWRMRNGRIIGKTQDYHEKNKNGEDIYPLKTRYFIKNEN